MMGLSPITLILVIVVLKSLGTLQLDGFLLIFAISMVVIVGGLLFSIFRAPYRISAP
jgi:hypothetical protein